MENIKELYFLGKPIETEIGVAHFLKVKDYHQLIQHVGYLNIEKFEVIEPIKKVSEEAYEEIKDLPFITIIHELSPVISMYDMLKKLFILCFDEDVFDKIIDDEQFEYYRTLIREMNCINYEKKNPNPEIERYNQLKRLYNRKKMGGDITLESMATSVWLASGINVLDLTIYQMYALFNRLSQFKNYDTTILYNSVAGNITIDLWYKHVDMFEGNEGTTLEEFTEYANNIIKNN